INRVASPSPPQRISIRPSIASEPTGAGDSIRSLPSRWRLSQEQIAGCDLDLLVAVHEPGFARAVSEKMEEYDVVRARQAGRRRMQAVLRLDTPRRLELGFDIDGGKNVGQGVHQ